MKGFSIKLNKAADGLPVSIEVSALYEKHILEHIRKVVPMTYLQLNASRVTYQEKGMGMIRLVLPEVSNDQLSQIAWHIGEWYSRMEPLVNTDIN